MNATATPPRLRPEWVIQRQGKPAVLYAGLLALATEDGLQSIAVTILQLPDEANDFMAVATATVTMADGRVFTDVGDAKPSNVGPNIKGHILRMAATRAKARALRDAVNVGLVALEELGEEDEAPAPRPQRPPEPTPIRAAGNGWQGVWARWEALAGQAAAAGVPAELLTPIQPEMPRDDIAARIETVKVAIARAKRPADGGLTADQIDELPF